MFLAGQTLADLALGHCSWLNPLPVAWHDALHSFRKGEFRKDDPQVLGFFGLKNWAFQFIGIQQHTETLRDMKCRHIA